MSIADGPIWLVGSGNMGGAMLRRWLDAGIDPASVTVFTRTPREGGAVRHLTARPPGEAPTILILAVKPQQLDEAAAMLGAVDGALVVSILAGVDIAALRARFPMAGAIVRAMPNLPVAIGRGVVALCGDAGSPTFQRAERLVAPLGLVERIDDEGQFDAVTALAGCGPGFVFRFIDALAAAGVALGLPHDQALRLAIATVDGAGAMAAAADAPPATLADRVASPGGSTRAGLNVLDCDQALFALMTETLAASARRNAKMAADARRD